MKAFIICFLCTALNVFSSPSIDEPKLMKMFGETNFSKSNSESLKTELNMQINHKIYEPNHKKWSVVLTNVINPEIDHFQNEIRVNVFTTIGIEF
jgi:hypothetical protein